MNTPTITQRIATKAIIANAQGQILILREADTYEEGTNHGRYHLPGGRLNAGEPFRAGLKREIMEETGLEVEQGEPVFVGEWFPVIKGQPNQIVAIFFACRAATTEVRLSEEHDHFVWIDPADAGHYDIMDPEPEAIQAWVKRFS
ncbi:MAG TPA: NUDIX domain-containing protein [Candidatus Saccharimonadia bacterium]